MPCVSITVWQCVAFMLIAFMSLSIPFALSFFSTVLLIARISALLTPIPSIEANIVVPLPEPSLSATAIAFWSSKTPSTC